MTLDAGEFELRAVPIVGRTRDWRDRREKREDEEVERGRDREGTWRDGSEKGEGEGRRRRGRVIGTG